MMERCAKIPRIVHAHESFDAASIPEPYALRLGERDQYSDPGDVPRLRGAPISADLRPEIGIDFPRPDFGPHCLGKHPGSCLCDRKVVCFARNIRQTEEIEPCINGRYLLLRRLLPFPFPRRLLPITAGAAMSIRCRI